MCMQSVRAAASASCALLCWGSPLALPPVTSLRGRNFVALTLGFWGSPCGALTLFALGVAFRRSRPGCGGRLLALAPIFAQGVAMWRLSLSCVGVAMRRSLPFISRGSPFGALANAVGSPVAFSPSCPALRVPVLWVHYLQGLSVPCTMLLRSPSSPVSACGFGWGWDSGFLFCWGFLLLVGLPGRGVRVV